MTVYRGAGTMSRPRPSTASLTRDHNGRKPLGKINMNRPSTASSTRQPREKKKNAYKRLGALYGMNSTSSFPKTRGGIIKRPTTAPNKRKILERLRTKEIQEKEKHRYSYWRHDTSILTKSTMLNNVNPSPRDPKADERYRRRKLHDQSWKMGRTNTLSSSRSGPPKVEVDSETGEVRVLPAESKGWPLDNSMKTPWGPNSVADPWQKPLNSVPPGDWPKDKWSTVTPRGLHHPWSPPRHGSSTTEPLLGDSRNIRSKGTRKSILSKTTPSEYLKMKEVASASNKRRPTTAAPTRSRNSRPSSGKVQFMNSVRAAREETSNIRDDSPMRGSIKPKQRYKKRPQSAAPSPARRHKEESNNQSHETPVRKTPLRSKSSSGVRSSPGRNRPMTAGPSGRKLNKNNQAFSTPNLRSKIRPHTASASSPYRNIETGKSPSTLLSAASPTNRPHTAHAGGGYRSGGIRKSASATTTRRPHTAHSGGSQPKYLRPTTATRTKQLYRTGQWPSGRWKMEHASHFVPMTHKQRKKSFHVKHKTIKKIHDDPNVISSSSSEDEEEEEEEEDGVDGEERADALKASRRARRQREAQMRKRPMVAGQRKPRRRFEQKSLEHFTVLRSAPLKKHHVHLVLGKKLQERNRRCDGRDVATSWILANPKFKQMKLARFWNQFKPLALENIEATQLLQRLRKSAAIAAGGHDGYEDVNVDSASIDDSNQLNRNGIEIPKVRQDGETDGTAAGFPVGIHVVDSTPWLNEYREHPFMWITRPQFIHQMRILMSLNETHNNLRALNRLFSSFDVDVEDKMNAREFCIVLSILREERKRSVWAGKRDVNPVFEDAKKKYRQRTVNESLFGRMDMN
jgi:hypothetical protein